MLRLRRHVYLDNNATTQPSPFVLRCIKRVLETCHGNPSSRYRIAQKAATILEEAREQVATAVGATAAEIVFTGSASEANNQVLKSFIPSPASTRRTIISTPIEHPSVMKTLEALEAFGVNLVFCPLDDDGKIDFTQLEALLDTQTALLCCMLANNETGAVQDVARAAALAHAAGARIFCDCVQALGKIPVDVRALDVDYASFSAHKIHGPKGVGALYVRSGAPLVPLIHGGHQEEGRRAGTEGLHNIAGFGAACSEVPQLLSAMPHVAMLRDRLAATITALTPATVHTPSGSALPNTLSVALSGIDNGHAIALLDYHGIAVSAGSACNTEANEPSHVLKALGLNDDAARQTLRFSLSAHTTAADIAYVERVLRTYLASDDQESRFPVTMVKPAQLNEDMLSNDKLFILDIRNTYDRKFLKGLPGSHETSFRALKHVAEQIPRKKAILVVCQAGTDGAMAAYYLRAKGFRDVSFVIGGVLGWRLAQPELYRRLGNQNTMAFGNG
jgi:cysteine desulfurase